MALHDSEWVGSLERRSTILFSLTKRYFLHYEKLREERIVSDDLDAALSRSTLPSEVIFCSVDVVFLFHR
jgi:hypothetical protein